MREVREATHPLNPDFLSIICRLTLLRTGQKLLHIYRLSAKGMLMSNWYFWDFFSFPENKSLNLIDITITYGPILNSSTGASFLIATILTTPLTLATWRRRRILMTPPHLPSTSAWESLVKCWAEMKTDTPASIASQRFQSQVWSRAVSTSARYAGEAQTLRWVLWLFNV